MDIFESLNNTILLSNDSLKSLHHNKETINNIEHLNIDTSKQLNISKNIITSFTSFFNKITYNYFNTESSINDTYTNNVFNTETLNKTPCDIMNKLKQIKKNNQLIGLELEDHNKKLEIISINIDKNKDSLKLINYKVKNLFS
jgi:hypothetical protein